MYIFKRHRFSIWAGRQLNGIAHEPTLCIVIHLEVLGHGFGYELYLDIWHVKGDGSW